MIVALLAAAALLAESAPVASTAPAANPTAVAAPAPAAKKQADMVCKSEPVLGSRMPVRKCRTAAQAAQDKLDAQQELERAQGAMANNPH